ncbi:MAG: DUF4157 domain-containing protein [Deltaproteobacteria bacterium]|nr:DUF4157 domain-containing protein [Deltaproteobacteria bacterium]
MHTFTGIPKTVQKNALKNSCTPGRARLRQKHDVNSILNLQRAMGNQTVQQVLRSQTEGPNGGLADTASLNFGHDFSRLPIHSRKASAIQTKLAINRPGDKYEQEADRISEQVMRMDGRHSTHTAPPAIQRLHIGAGEELATKPVQRLCTECEEEMLHRKTAPAVAHGERGQAQHQAEAKVDAVRSGHPLAKEQRAFFEPRFGVDFSHVRIHTDQSADRATRAVGAHAFTRGSHIVFREDRYHPHTYAGQQLLAHELTHVVQQGAAPPIQHRFENEKGEQHIKRNELHMGMAGNVVQCWPGDGMVPPGDCSWATYLALRGSVETAKAIVSTLGACSAGDNCLTLATKIAAITAEIAARVALDTTCFRGGDSGHRQQVQDKVNMMNRCYRFFNASNCPPELIAAMAVVVQRARDVIAAGAAVVAIAVVVALIVAIIALAKAIAALAAAAGAGAGALATATAVIALLVLIKEEISPDESSSA